MTIVIFLPACEQRAGTSVSEKISKQQKPIIDYQAARSVFWGSLYRNGGQTLYCGQQFQSHNRKGLNIEHVFPMSWVTKSLNCGSRKQCRQRSETFNHIEADLHNLYPARTRVNEDRSSYRFGEVSGEARRYGQSCDFEVSERTRTAEPAPAVRGEVARAMFYMAYKYHRQGLVIFARQGRLLYSWHQSDPPGSAERQRNDQIEKLQGNRNPFIDEPHKLDKLVVEGFFF